MICVAWIKVPGDIEINFLWDSGRFPVVCVRGEELKWQEYAQAFGSAVAVHYHELAWENRIQWTPARSIDWHKRQTGVYEITDSDLSRIDWETFK